MSNYGRQSSRSGVVAIVFIYIASNIFSAVSALLNSGKFTGSDFEEFGFETSSLLLNLYLVVIFYLLALLLYRSLQRKSDSALPSNRDVVVLGWIAFIVQFIYMLCLTTGGVSLQQLKNEPSFATYFQTLFVPDYIFLAYYALGRESRLFYPNLVLYLISTLLRGLAGGFIFLIFFELLLSFKRSKWLFFKILIWSLVICSPFIYETRKLIRAAPPDYFLKTSISEHLIYIFNNAYMHINILDALFDMTNIVFMRLQHLSSPVMIFDHLDDFWLGDAKGRFLSFFFEGQPQATIFGKSLTNSPPLSEYITTALLPTPFGSWFIHPSLVGWLWVNPFEFPLLVVYCILLCALSIFLVRKLGGRDYAVACTFLSFIIFAMNGWFGPYISTIQALVILWVVSSFANLIRISHPFRFGPSRCRVVRT